MARRILDFRILLIDDDVEMNTRMEKVLSGHRLSVGRTEVIPQVDRLDVSLEQRGDYWKISETTLKRLHLLSRSPRYDLVMADFGFATEEAKDILWGKDRSRHPTKEDAKGRLLTVRDLRYQFEEWAEEVATKAKGSVNVFTAARRVVLRSFASRLAFDILGPVVPDRSNQTQQAFPNADVLPVDSRQEFFATDEFYDIYERPDGRDFYRYLVGTYSLRIIESEMLRYLVRLSGKLRVRRSVFNIAVFAAAVAAIGGVAQYLAGLGFGFIDRGQSTGWWLFGAGLLLLVLGALALGLTFEWFARSVIRWVGAEEEFTRE